MKGKSKKIKIGEFIGDWEILSHPLKLPGKSYRSVLVKCKCNNEQYISFTSLYQQTSTKCLSCRKKERKCKMSLPIGSQYGEWVIIGEAYTLKSQTHIPVRCSCGFESSLNKYSLMNGSQCCSSCASFKGVGDLAGAYITEIKRRAKKRGLEFNITTQQLWDLINQQDFKCALTGESITVNKNWRKYDFTASLDRINSTKGYTLDNIQWVHKRINKLKSNFTEDELKFWVEKLYNYQK